MNVELKIFDLLETISMLRQSATSKFNIATEDGAAVKLAVETKLGRLSDPGSLMWVEITAKKGSPEEPTALRVMEVIVQCLKARGVAYEALFRQTAEGDRIDCAKIPF